MENKIVIVGCPSSGKTTFANKLGLLLDIPVYHLDKIFWVQKGGIKQDDFIRQQEDIMKQKSWIIDGHFPKSKSFDLRLEKAHTIILFDFPKRIIYWRLLKRILTNYGKERHDMPKGHKTFFDWDLVKYIWKHSIEEVIPKIMAYSNIKKVVVLKNPQDEKKFLKEFH